MDMMMKRSAAFGVLAEFVREGLDGLGGRGVGGG
jgi:hypothetical protein